MLWCQCLLFGHFVVVLVWCVGCTRLQMDDISNHEIADEDFPTSTTNNSDQNHIVNEVSTVGRMGWINYFKVESKKLDSTGKTKPRSEIEHAWKALYKEDKASYGHMYVDNIASTSHSKKQTQQNPSETHEECDSNESLIGADDQNMVHTRFTPSRLCWVVDKFSEEQKDVVRALGFENLILLQCGRLHREVCGWLVSNFDTESRSLHIHGKTIKVDSSCFAHVMGILDHGDTKHIHGVVPNLDYWGSKFSITSRGIDVKHIEHRIQLITTSDDEFKVTFCPFMLGTLLAPRTTNYVDAGYLIPLFTVTDICNKNWSSWCFNLLCDGIQKYKLGQTRRYLSGCILFLQLFYVHSIHWEPPFVDKSLPPIVCWANVKIKKCLLRLRTEGGGDSNKVHLVEMVTKASHGEKCQVYPLSSAAGHGTPYVMDSDMGTEELPYDERIDDDHDGSNDDYDILNVQVPKFVPSLLDEDVKDEEIKFSNALDIVLASEIDVNFPSTFSFSSFTITTFTAPEQQNCYDYGLFVCMFMDDNYPSPNQMVTFDSETYRLLLGRFLAVVPENNHLKQLQLDAQNHPKELLSKGLQLNGKKRPGGKQAITKVKGLKR
ncbi:hypothetical protein Ddye_016704 [Dipteronia dyeriana]|uniref:Ubiquitin-like protease family profile domain-containing protein n=1 Tax=Dipteronia dyeriana TaxID=168575 RepID=A0AAD9X0S3_9ROSI|nr:hypothetical protein Ddye_016704 [Dipteronia dyeriana]